MHFDGAVNGKGAGLGVIIITPEGESFPIAKQITYKVTNNMVEYEACIYSLEALVTL